MTDAQIADLLADRVREPQWKRMTHSGRVVYTLVAMLGGHASESQLVAAWTPENLARAVTLLDRAGALR